MPAIVQILLTMIAFSALLLLAGCSEKPATEPVSGVPSCSLPLPFGEWLTIDLPPTWNIDLAPDDEHEQLMVQVSANEDTNFLCRFAVAWGADTLAEFHPMDALRSRLKSRGERRDLPRSIEDEIVLQDISGPLIQGSYYTVQDSNPEIIAPLTTRGAAVVDPWVLIFSIYFKDRDSASHQRALEMIASARPDDENRTPAR